VAWPDDGGPAWSRYEVVPTICLQRVVVSGGISGSKDLQDFLKKTHRDYPLIFSSPDFTRSSSSSNTSLL
jgi:hypothetical protein